MNGDGDGSLISGSNRQSEQASASSWSHCIAKDRDNGTPRDNEEDQIQALISAGADEALLRSVDHSIVTELWRSLLERTG